MPSDCMQESLFSKYFGCRHSIVGINFELTQYLIVQLICQRYLCYYYYYVCNHLLHASIYYYKLQFIWFMFEILWYLFYLLIGIIVFNLKTNSLGSYFNWSCKWHYTNYSCNIVICTASTTCYTIFNLVCICSPNSIKKCQIWL